MRVRSNDVFTTAIGGETVILDVRTSTYFTTNLVGTAILELLQNDQSFEQVVEAIASDFGVARDVARADCEKFVDQLAEHGLLEDER